MEALISALKQWADAWNEIITEYFENETGGDELVEGIMTGRHQMIEQLMLLVGTFENVFPQDYEC